ncbi:MAG TPA: class I SAM-dependent methyltransferase [Thermoanaerobaculia bacterium]|nr:class I SAM-dependent methyltransferase [Thermoanaerobaculia bacterium]
MSPTPPSSRSLPLDAEMEALGRDLVRLDGGLGIFRLAHLLDALGERPTGTVLSIGSGGGLHESLLAHAFPDVRVVGVDRRAPYAPPKQNLTFLEGDLLDPRFQESLPLAEFVYSIECLEHIDDDASVVRAAASRVAPGGLLYVQVPFASDAEQADPELCRVERENHEHVRPGYAGHQLAKLVSNAGLEPVSVAGAFWFPYQPLVWIAIEKYGPEPLAPHWREVLKIAELDVRPGLPASRNEATAIKILARR